MAALERINLNLAPGDRARIRALAKSAGTPEAVLARELLVSALGRAEREALGKRLKACWTPERRARERVILAALDRLGNQPRPKGRSFR
jgi:hypothetical protein